MRRFPLVDSTEQVTYRLGKNCKKTAKEVAITPKISHFVTYFVWDSSVDKNSNSSSASFIFYHALIGLIHETTHPLYGSSISAQRRYCINAPFAFQQFPQTFPRSRALMPKYGLDFPIIRESTGHSENSHTEQNSSHPRKHEWSSAGANNIKMFNKSVNKRFLRQLQ